MLINVTQKITTNSIIKEKYINTNFLKKKTSKQLTQTSLEEIIIKFWSMNFIRKMEQSQTLIQNLLNLLQ